MFKIFVATAFILGVFISKAQQVDNFLKDADAFFSSYVDKGLVDYNNANLSKDLAPLIAEIKSFNFEEISGDTQKAYLINVYNLLVIDQIKASWPTTSPMNINGFFDGTKNDIGTKSWTLNELENDFMRPTYNDPRLHFVLVCGAQGCPPIINSAYMPATLDAQLEEQTKIALNNPVFIRTTNGLEISEIFKWYTSDFTKDGNSVIDYLNTYRDEKIDAKSKFGYYAYNWSVNAQSQPTSSNGSITSNEDNSPQGFDLQTYNAGSLLKKGKFDVSLFNSIYTQSKSEWMGNTFSGFRETFYSSLLQFTYGVSENARINLGVDLKFSGSGFSSDSSFTQIKRAFAFENNDSTRVGLALVGPRVKIQPFANESNFTIQSSLLFPTTSFGEGRGNDPNTAENEALYFLEWDRIQWWNQFFYVKTYNKTQLFLEADIWYRIGYKENQASALDLPITAIFSYFPTPKTTVYALASHLTRHQFNPNGYNDGITTAADYTSAGIGFKYQITSKINLELLYTNFLRGTNSGLGNTFNIGLRYVH